MDDGARLLTAALGPQEGTVAHELARLTGVRAESATQVLKLAGPLALGAIANILGGPPTAQGLADLLQAETPALERALPAPLRAALAPLVAEPSPLHGTTAEGAAAAAASSARWLPWLLAAVAAVALVAGLQRFATRDEGAREAAPAPPPMVTEVPPEPVALPDGTTLRLMPGSVAHELVRFLAGPEPAPREIRFEPHAETFGAPDATTAAAAREVAAVLAAFPAARIRLVGHAHAGEADMSAARAEALAALLVARGVALDRVESEGRGAAEPIATNDTAEGRAQNSRVMLVVTAK
jgi:outer membrane protein OmpA-like peptidoglycan-associated protein